MSRGVSADLIIYDEFSSMALDEAGLPMFDEAIACVRELEMFWGDFEPAAPWSYANGRLPMSALAPIGGGYYLEKEAAAAYNAMKQYIHDRTGFWISVISGYRPYAQQVYLWDHVAHAHDTNWVARPGTSNHGLGVAIDLANTTSRYYINLYGAPFGWSKAWSDAPVEWWHIKYQTGHYHPGAGTATKILFTKQERHTVAMLMATRKLPHSGSSKIARQRRENVRQAKVAIRKYRSAIRVAARRDGWNKLDRKRRYDGLLIVYNGGKVKL